MYMLWVGDYANTLSLFNLYHHAQKRNSAR